MNDFKLSSSTNNMHIVKKANVTCNCASPRDRAVVLDGYYETSNRQRLPCTVA